MKPVVIFSWPSTYMTDITNSPFLQFGNSTFSHDCGYQKNLASKIWGNIIFDFPYKLHVSKEKIDNEAYNNYGKPVKL